MKPSLADFGIGVPVHSQSRPEDFNRPGQRHAESSTAGPPIRRCDNFYCDSDHSADGHRWLQGVYPGVFCETSTSASYGGGRRH